MFLPCSIKNAVAHILTRLTSKFFSTSNGIRAYACHSKLTHKNRHEVCADKLPARHPNFPYARRSKEHPENTRKIPPKIRKSYFGGYSGGYLKRYFGGSRIFYMLGYVFLHVVSFFLFRICSWSRSSQVTVLPCSSLGRHSRGQTQGDISAPAEGSII